MEMVTTIKKTYGRKVSRDYQSWTFETTIEGIVNAKTPDDVVKEGEKLFKFAKTLTDQDITKTLAEIQPQG